MHYPTHSTSGPISVMKARAVKVCACGFPDPTGDPYFAETAFTDETALFFMSNGATMRICEHRQVGHPGTESFSLYGTKGSFLGRTWFTNRDWTEVSVEEMRDPLPPEVFAAFEAANPKSVYGGHGGSHAYLVHEFVLSVAEDRQPAINIWEAVRYMAPGVMAHKSCLKDGEILEVPDWGDAPEG